MSELLDPSEREELSKRFPEWDIDERRMSRTFEFDDFMEGIDFVNLLADVAEKAGHHPDIDIRYRRVTAVLTTHDAGGLTESDAEMAQRINHLAG